MFQCPFGFIPNFIRPNTEFRFFSGCQFHRNLVKAKFCINIFDKTQNFYNFFFQLLFGTENMRIILGKFAHTHQAGQSACCLISINLAKFRQIHRQIFIRFNSLTKYQHSPRTRHRLYTECFSILGFSRIIVFTIFRPMPTAFPQRPVHNRWG